MLSPPPEKKKGKKKEAWIPTRTKLRIEMSSVLSIMDPHRPAVCVKQCPRPDHWIPQETGTSVAFAMSFHTEEWLFFKSVCRFFDGTPFSLV